MKQIKNYSPEMDKAKGRNIENMVGCIQVPLGLAGPLKVNGKEYQVPLATTEGALVASVNRGCKATFLGGVKVRVMSVGASRGPVFKVTGLDQGIKLIAWVDKNFTKLKQVARKGEKHLELLSVNHKMVGKNVYLRFEFETEEAMGMNMVTIATAKIVELMEKKLGVGCVALSGNYCVDKKPSWINFIEGRGKQVWAEVVIDRKTVRQVLKTTPEKIVEVVYRKQLLGSIMAGSMGFNGHYANVVGAIFLATGQDIAHLVEGSLGVTTAEIDHGKLYFSIYLPSLMLGTVGGGTHLVTQKEALGILGLGKNKKGESMKLAEVVGGAVLAGELSLTAALASRDLAKAHQRLGRGKK